MRKVTASGVSVVVLILAVLIGLDWYVRDLGPRAKTRVIKELSERFDANVTLKDLQLSLLPHPAVSGGPLSIRHRGWNDPHPLIYIRRFSAQSTFFSLFFQRDRVRLLNLEGFEIHVPHRGKVTSQTTHVDDEELESDRPGTDRKRLKIGIETLVADGTLLEIEPKETGRDPMRFDIKNLQMHSVGPGEPMRFDAVLSNPKPPGIIVSSGRFGPWQTDDPRATAVSGEYTFRNANLAVFSGISGTLSSTGQYGGVLGRINVKGHTDVPDFALKRGGMPVHLAADFQSTVNGMNGDTILEDIQAHFLNTDLQCKGGVTHQGPVQGKTVNLVAATGKSARIEDILQLVMGSRTPLMRGNIRFESTILVPPGKRDVLDKLRLNGKLEITSAVFSSPEANRKIGTLSLRARGINKDDQRRRPTPVVASDLRANFRLHDGSMDLLPLVFAIPGALVRLNGTFALPSQKLDFDGSFRMQATLSDTQSGIKHWLLKPLDPIFEKDGAGLQLPFKVTGTEDHPTLAVSAFHHTFQVK